MGGQSGVVKIKAGSEPQTYCIKRFKKSFTLLFKTRLYL